MSRQGPQAGIQELSFVFGIVFEREFLSKKGAKDNEEEARHVRTATSTDAHKPSTIPLATVLYCTEVYTQKALSKPYGVNISYFQY